jgi:VWFA-related protein
LAINSQQQIGGAKLLIQNNATRLLAIALSAFIFHSGIDLRASAQTGQPPSSQVRPRTTTTTRPQQTPAPPRTTSAPSPSTSSAAQGGADDDEVVRVNTDVTNVLFTAVNKEQRFITTLRREDVRIYEDGAPQTLLTFERETNLPLSLAILIDTSESQTGVLPEEKAAARAFLDAVVRPEKDHAAIISFTGKWTIEQNLTNNIVSLRRAIDRVKPGLSRENIARYEAGEDPLTFEEDPSGYTNIWDTIYTTADEILSKTPEQTRRAIILLTDGDDTHSRIKRQDAIDRAIKANVAIYSIGIRDENFPEGKMQAGTLRKISDNTGGRAFFPQPVSALSNAFADIEQELRSQYLAAYSPTNKRFNGAFRQLHVEVINPELRRQKLRLLYRQGYYARSTTATASAPSR